MIQAIDTALDRRLDALEHRGRRHLAAVARGAALRAGRSAAMSATILLPLFLLVLIAMGVAGVAALGAVAVAVPLLGFGVGHVLASRRAATRREAALALFDRQPGMNDRVRIADEFADHDDRDGFRAAALSEAQPWLDRALDAPIAPLVRVERSTGLRWTFIVAALVLALLVIAIGGGRPGTSAPGAMAVAARQALASVGVRAGDPVVVAPDDRRAAEAASREARSDGAGGGSGAGERVRGAAGDGDAARRGAGDPGSRAGAAAAAGHSPASADPAAPGTGRSAGRGGTDADRASASPATAERGGARAADSEGGDGSAPATTQSPARQPERSTLAPAAAAPGGAPPPPRAASDSGKGARPNSPNRQQGGQQSSQNQGQGSSRAGQQGSGQGTGRDAIKKTRGTSALLLAVPMEDRVIGAVNAGRITSVTRPSVPQARAVGIVAAGDRGGQRGDAGRIAHRTTTVQEDAMLDRFFRRRAGP